RVRRHLALRSPAQRPRASACTPSSLGILFRSGAPHPHPGPRPPGRTKPANTLGDAAAGPGGLAPVASPAAASAGSEGLPARPAGPARAVSGLSALLPGAERARGGAPESGSAAAAARPALPPEEPRSAAPASPSRAGAGRTRRLRLPACVLRPGRPGAARGAGPAAQAMGEGGAVGRRRPFPGAPRRRWWRRQQQQQRQRQRWWPGRGEGECAGRAAMGLAGLQVGVSGPAARGAGGARGPAGPGGGRATRVRPGPAGRPRPPGGAGGPPPPGPRNMAAAGGAAAAPGRKMSKPRAVEAAAAAAAVAATAPGPEMVERRGPGRPRTDGENVFAGQSKIYSYMSPNKCSGMRSPLQEENSVAHHEVKCQGKPLTGVYRKREADSPEVGRQSNRCLSVLLAEKRSPGSAIRSAVKAEEQKLRDARRGPLAPFPNQKPEAAEPPKTPASSCDSPNVAVAKPTLKKPVRGKQAPRKNAQGKPQRNRKLTDFYPVRRSSRKSKAELQSEERRRIDELIESGKEEGMKIDLIDGKGRGVIATKQFSRGEFVVEYHGDLIEITDAKKREALYAQDPSTGCYMYYFHVDATRETNRLGRLINHSKCGNCQTKLHDIDGVPHLILIASRDIAAGEELLYDYGDRSRASIAAYPWLKH
ncbi:N-lysine methyltransferase KMT5A, partial [Galemys pyrenaicus]